jgi:hypothetical protein
MSTIIKLVIAGLILTAAVQFGRASMSNYQFEDELQQALQFSPNATDEELTTQIVTLAADHGLRVEAENVELSMRGDERSATIRYSADVAFVPGLFSRPIAFAPTATVRLLRAPRR